MAKIIPITSPRSTRDKLVEATAIVLAREGYLRISLQQVAEKAGVSYGMALRKYGGLRALVRALGESPGFWPPASELLGDDATSLSAMESHAQMAAYFKRCLRALLDRPRTLDILAWEAVERNELTRLMEDSRVHSALEFFEHLTGEVPEEDDLSTVVLILAVAVQQLAVRSRNTRSMGGVDLTSDIGWARVERAIDKLVHGYFALSAPDDSAGGCP
ncbi:TetR/AcrR family transcriptional regulator [Oceanidesulfovibrio indonesiensis]|uniref:TetR/AcrR family transcriptional regulator n=2 Tax=Oceanidesulfovibrio indonesiensis TaxID=54767 RepID=A0A7M3MAL2_9BACT|nr:TetR/AcrR family transcriptional regulator [Oceanidesulfovibrio indonesiensis]